VTDFNQSPEESHVGAAEASPIQQPDARLTRPGHDPVSGRFLADNSDSVKDGKYSRRFQDAVLPGQEQLRAAIAERRIEWATDLGDDLSFGQKDLINRGLRLHVILDTLEANMEREGVLTAKGATRAAVTLYLSVLDRLTKIYQQLGLERRAKPIKSVGEIMREHANTP
jgi:hypothetical protein